MKESFYSRNFEVKYYEMEEHIWKSISHLNDNQHDILVTVDVSVPDMIILNANVDFLNAPMKQCILIKEKMKELIGVNIFTEFNSKANELFFGEMGCPNIRLLLGISVPAIIYSYFPHQIKIGKMTEKQWWDMCKDRLANACISHSLMNVYFL